MCGNTTHLTQMTISLTSKCTFIPSKRDNHLIVNALQNILKTRVFRAKGELFLNLRVVQGHL